MSLQMQQADPLDSDMRGGSPDQCDAIRDTPDGNAPTLLAVAARRGHGPRTSDGVPSSMAYGASPFSFRLANRMTALPGMTFWPR